MEILYTLNANLKIRADAAKPKDFFRVMDFLGDLPNRCGNCSKADLHFRKRQAKNKEGKEVDYYEVQCKDCGHRLLFGQNMDQVSLFAKQWEPPYDPNASGGEGGQQQQQRTQAAPGEGSAPADDWG